MDPASIESRMTTAGCTRANAVAARDRVKPELSIASRTFTRIGADFDSLGVAWQTAWFRRR
jgi:hypothetical protein